MTATLCFLTLLLTSVVVLLMMRLIRSENSVSNTRFYDGWRSVFEAWRNAETNFERCLVLVLILAQVFRGGKWALVVVYIAFGIAALAAICGWQLPDVLKAARDILRDLYQFLNGEQPPAVAPPARN
jgi:hypothetical protein